VISEALPPLAADLTEEKIHHSTGVTALWPSNFSKVPAQNRRTHLQHQYSRSSSWLLIYKLWFDFPHGCLSQSCTPLDIISRKLKKTTMSRYIIIETGVGGHGKHTCENSIFQRHT